MKVQMYKERNKNTEPLLLQLEETSYGVKLISVDEDGEWDWDILAITTKGELFRFSSINGKTGLSLEDGGKVTLVDSISSEE